MNRAAGLVAVAAGAALVATTLPATAAPHSPSGRDLGRETLGDNDGWASAEGGTTGGAEATEDNVVTVDTWARLKEAVRGDEPKIVRVEGHISAMTDADGGALSCSDFNDPEYDWDDYVAEYDPEHWDGRAEGPLEDARVRSYEEHREHVLLRPGSNTTIVGSGDASISDGGVLLESVDNVILRNLGIHDAYDCFPEWLGDEWDAQYDNIEVSRSEHVWLDHLTLTDGDTPDSELDEVYGEQVDRHDGIMDIVRASDLVTASWNSFEGHDKSMLWGNTDSEEYDEWDELRITLHHNDITNLSQRAPRVRYGQVHVYNNLYTHERHADYPYLYSWGAGVESRIHAQNNYFHLADDIGAGEVIHSWGGTSLYEEGSVLNGRPTDLLAAYNEANPDNQLDSDVGWTPEHHETIHPTWAVPGLVHARAGAGGLG
ncbi:pectate lyase family protein [Halostreptopolyspora alba]|uniref:pectate lyase family protein n=1 Tax=Halostreptopolyspora alba TaxID=2487137 RepID=UPI0026A26697